MTVVWFDPKAEERMKVSLIDACQPQCEIKGAMVCGGACPIAAADMLELLQRIDEIEQRQAMENDASKDGNNENKDLEDLLGSL